MTQGKRLSPKVTTEEVKRLIRETMIREDEIERNASQLARILELFEEIDAFEEHVKDLDPLYHPLDQLGEPRDDVPANNNVKLEEFVKNVKDGFLRAPRL